MAVGDAFLAAEPSGTETNVLSEPVGSALERRLSSRFHSHNQRFSQVNHKNTKVEELSSPLLGRKDCLSLRTLESSQVVSRQPDVQLNSFLGVSRYST